MLTSKATGAAAAVPGGLAALLMLGRLGNEVLSGVSSGVGPSFASESLLLLNRPGSGSFSLSLIVSPGV